MKKRIFIFMLILPLLLLAACSKESSALANLSDMELESNQTLMTGQVTSRVGNDIELALGSLQTMQGPVAAEEGDAQGDDGATMPSGDGADMPTDGEMPSGGGGPQGGGEMPSDGEMPEGMSGQAPEDASDSGSQDAAGTDTTNVAGASIQLSGETMSLTIPVGTKVLVTATDGTLSASSFGRIQTDDIVQLILQTQDDGTQIVTLVQIME
jgi:hypothetical protein